MPRYALTAAAAVIALTALAVIVIAAGKDDGSDELASARARWAAQDASDYRYRLRLSCFCGTAVTAPATVRVKAGRPRSTRAAIREYDTVDELFTVVEEAQARAESVEVRYAPDTGIPTRIAIDWSADTSDDELTLTVSRIRVSE
jgi:hypothetical protein